MVAVPYANIVAPVGRNFFAGTPAEVTQIVSPSANTSGVIIRTGYMVNAGLYADVTPPSAVGDLTKRVVFNANPGVLQGLPYPLFVPPGLGVWYAPGGGSGINITWDLVSADFAANIN
jgi:hypothetical protein